MKTLKKIAACAVAAAMATTCVAVTACADYQINGKDDESAYLVTISGIPKKAFD